MNKYQFNPFSNTFDYIEYPNRTINFIMDGVGSPITSGIKGDIGIPFNCTIKTASLYADTNGSIVVNIWKDTYANFPPTVDDKITSGTPPTINNANKSKDSTLANWTIQINSGDILRINVDSCALITRCTLALDLE